MYRLNSSEKLDQLLPRLRGIPADFVFNQLGPEVRSDYHALVYELRKHFQTFETPRMYQSQYDRRRQKSGESAHIFAKALSTHFTQKASTILYGHPMLTFILL